MLERRPGVTRLMDRLESKALVSRTRDDADRRRVVCTIREKGLDLLGTLDREVARVDGILLHSLSEPEVTEMTELLNRLRSAVSER